MVSINHKQVSWPYSKKPKALCHLRSALQFIWAGAHGLTTGAARDVPKNFLGQVQPSKMNAHASSVVPSLIRTHPAGGDA